MTGNDRAASKALLCLAIGRLVGCGGGGGSDPAPPPPPPDVKPLARGYRVAFLDGHISRVGHDTRFSLSPRPPAAQTRLQLRTLMKRAALMLCALACWHGSAMAALTDLQDDALTLLVLGPKPNPVKTCVNFALELNLGLTFMKLGQASDAEVRDSLLEGAEDAAALQRRTAKAEEWARSRSPEKLAQMDLQQCLQSDGLSFTVGEPAQRCFGQAGLAAEAELYKSGGLSASKALATLQRGRGAGLPHAYLQQLVAAVYAKDRVASEHLVHRQVFVQCMGRATRSP